MSAEEKYKELLLSFPAISSDFDGQGVLTDEAALRATVWAMEQLSEVELVELDAEQSKRQRLKEATRLLEQMVAEGKAERVTDEAGQVGYRMVKEQE